MLETIKSQYESGKALIQSKNYHLSKRDSWPAFFHDLYPVGQDYYFELNPYFTFNVYHGDLYSFAKTFFVRDGRATFANFILRHYNFITKAKTHFIIDPSLAFLVPPNYQQYFSCWHMVQPKKKSIKEAKRILIFGILAEQYIGNLESVVKKIKPIQSLDLDVEVDIYLPQRKEPFETEGKESIFNLLLISKIKEMMGVRKINFIMTKELMEKVVFNGTYLIDLAYDNFTVSDNYVHYHVASRGGTVDAYSKEAPANSIFKLALSFNHEVHITPFPTNLDSIFMDLLFMKKTSTAQSALFDPAIHALLRT